MNTQRNEQASPLQPNVLVAPDRGIESHCQPSSRSYSAVTKVHTSTPSPLPSFPPHHLLQYPQTVSFHSPSLPSPFLTHMVMQPNRPKNHSSLQEDLLDLCPSRSWLWRGLGSVEAACSGTQRGWQLTKYTACAMDREHSSVGVPSSKWHATRRHGARE